MKTKLLFLSLMLCSWAGFAQVVAGQVDDFEDGTPQNWTIGNPALASTLISTPTDGGPDGVGDGYFSYMTTGSANGPGSRMVVYNQDTKWQGNYSEQDIVAINIHVKAETSDLNFRIAFQRGPNSSFTRIATSNSYTVTAGSGWTTLEIPVSASDFEIVDNFEGDYTIAEVLQDVSIMRIMSSASASWLGDVMSGSMQLDNIETSTTLSTRDFTVANEFEISPNPASSILNIKLPNAVENTKLTIYNVLGKRVYSQSLNAMTSNIDVSNWNAGVYLVRVSNDNITLTKRFVKQ